MGHSRNAVYSMINRAISLSGFKLRVTKTRNQGRGWVVRFTRLPPEIGTRIVRCVIVVVVIVGYVCPFIINNEYVTARERGGKEEWKFDPPHRGILYILPRMKRNETRCQGTRRDVPSCVPLGPHENVGRWKSGLSAGGHSTWKADSKNSLGPV